MQSTEGGGDGSAGGPRPWRASVAPSTRPASLVPHWYPDGPSNLSVHAPKPSSCRQFVKGERRDLNPRPPGPQPGALPTELRPPRENVSLAPELRLYEGARPPI